MSIFRNVRAGSITLLLLFFSCSALGANTQFTISWNKVNITQGPTANRVIMYQAQHQLNGGTWVTKNAGTELKYVMTLNVRNGDKVSARVRSILKSVRPSKNILLSNWSPLVQYIVRDTAGDARPKPPPGLKITRVTTVIKTTTEVQQ